MSMSGRMRAEMIKRQKEELRKNRVREQCSNMLSSIEAKMNQHINDPQFSHFFSDDASIIQNEISQANHKIQSDPDFALSMIQAASLKLNKSISSVVAAEKQWSDERKKSYEKLFETTEMLDSVPIRSTQYAQKIKSLSYQLKAFSDIATTSIEVEKHIANAQKEADAIVQKDEREEVRKEVVKKIISILKAQGFVVATPTLKEQSVIIRGKLPTGKKVLFQVQDEGSVDFDLDGYTGETCQNEIEGIIEKLNDEGNVDSSIEQFAWHNPDKIRKGSKEFPTSSGQTKYMKR